MKHPPGVPKLGLFLRNGGKDYIDIHNIPEYATPEASTPQEIVTHEIKGEEIQTDAYVKDGVTEDDPRVAVSLHKRCITPDGTASLGAHESYSTTVTFWNESKKEEPINVMATHMATRVVYSGAGHPIGDEFDENKFALGQKIQTVVELVGSQTTANKPLINTRNEPHNGGAIELNRFHNTSGDANISPWAIKMKLGTTSLMLRLLEHDVDMSDTILANPLHSAKIVAEGKSNLNTPLLLASGKTATALEIQEEFVFRAEELAKQVALPKQELLILEDWKIVLDNLNSFAKTGDDMEYLKRVDWYTKMQIMMGYSDRKGGLRGTQLEKLQLYYDQTRNGIGIKLREPGKRFSIDMPSDEELNAALLTPPEGRASMRGDFIQRIYDDSKGIPATADWGVLSYGGAHLKMRPQDDYSVESRTEKLDAFIHKIWELKKIVED